MKPGEPVRVQLKDILFCHKADLLIDGSIKHPAIPAINFPETIALSLRCSECGKRRCLVVTKDSAQLEFYDIDDESEIGSILAGKLLPLLESYQP